MLGLGSRFRSVAAVARLSKSCTVVNNPFKFIVGSNKYFSRNARDFVDLKDDKDEFTNEPVYSDDKDGYAVHSTDVVNPKIVRVPYLTPKMKADIYKLYTTEVSNNKDPANINNNNIIRSIAKKYNASYDRIQAVIFLAENKIKFMKEHEVDVISDDHNTIYRKIKELTDAIEIEKQKEAESKLKKSKKNKNVVPVAAVATAVDSPPSASGDGATPVPAPPKLLTIPELEAELSKEYNISVDEIKVIYERLQKHHIWLDNELVFNEYYDQLMNDYIASGVDISFRETSFEPKSKKNDNYYPRLFDDEEEEEEKRKIIKRVKDETRAVPDTDIFTYINKDAAKLKVPSANDSINNSERTKINRWKFGFKDLSEGKDARTVIYTRGGKLRYANPLEESKRSWVSNQPSLVDLALNKSSIEKYQDYDNDMVKVQEFIKSKSIRNNLILNEKNAKAAKK